MSVLIKGMEMPRGCGNCETCEEAYHIINGFDEPDTISCWWKEHTGLETCPLVDVDEDPCSICHAWDCGNCGFFNDSLEEVIERCQC